MRTCANALFVLLIASTPLPASSIIKKDLPELSREATAIVRARVANRTAAWDTDRRIIWTRYELVVHETWKGTIRPGRLALHEPGGIVGDVGQTVSGVPSYRVGEELVLFLWRDALGHWRTYGMVQGAFRIATRVDGTPGVRFTRGLHHVTEPVFPRKSRRPRVGVGLPAFAAAVKRLSTTTEGR